MKTKVLGDYMKISDKLVVNARYGSCMMIKTREIGGSVWKDMIRVWWAFGFFGGHEAIYLVFDFWEGFEEVYGEKGQGYLIGHWDS